MEFSDITVLIRLFLGALATFVGILLWSRTRDAAWILVVLGVLVSYAEIIFSTLEKFGIVRMESLTVPGVGVLPLEGIIKLFLMNLPLILFVVAFLLVITRRRIP